MIKTLLASLLLFAPVISGSFNSDNLQNNPVLQEKVDIKSSESESFVSYWKDEFRKDSGGNIIPVCDITYESYSVMYSKYVALDKGDRSEVDATPDYEDGYTIKDSIVELTKIHGKKSNSSKQEKQTLNQSSAITIVVVVAVFGMSVICLFYVMKNKNLIK